MAKRTTRKDVNTKKRTPQISDDGFENTDEMSDIPGNQVQLKVRTNKILHKVLAKTLARMVTILPL